MAGGAVRRRSNNCPRRSQIKKADESAFDAISYYWAYMVHSKVDGC
jgi:hypothetical protein